MKLNRGPALLALCLAAFIINLDTTIVNVALPSLVRETKANTTDLQWIVDAYNLVFAALILVAGSLSDRFGRKGMLLGGLLVFAASSAAGAMCTSPHQLIAARAFMGLGAAMIFPSTLSLISNVFVDRSDRAKAIGLWGATAGMGVAMGPIFGGWLLEHFWWGSIFVFIVPIAAIVALLVGLFVPTSRDESTPPIDKRGFVLSITAMTALILAVIQGPDWGWSSDRTLACFSIGLVLLAGFLTTESRTKNPMLDVRLFKNPRFTASSGSVTIAFFALSGFIFLITQYFQFVKAYSPFATGVRLLPVAGSVGASSVIGTRLAVRVGNKAIVATGLALFSGGLLWVSTGSQATSYLVIAAQMVVLGTGMGLTTAPATEAIMGVVPIEKAGVGSAVNDATRLFGATLGVAVIGSVASSLYTSKLASILPGGLPPRAVSAANGSVGGATIAAAKIQQAGFLHIAQRLEAAATTAFLHSLSGGCIVAGTVAAVGALVAAAFLPSRPGPVAKVVDRPARKEREEFELVGSNVGQSPDTW
ncbi:MAG TPA: MFS transporter [Acidimicrobiales bacterium]|nr:MFS transporter [Acidimicrobiales bacterium]